MTEQDQKPRMKVTEEWEWEEVDEVPEGYIQIPTQTSVIIDKAKELYKEKGWSKDNSYLVGVCDWSLSPFVNKSNYLLCDRTINDYAGDGVYMLGASEGLLPGIYVVKKEEDGGFSLWYDLAERIKRDTLEGVKIESKALLCLSSDFLEKDNPEIGLLKPGEKVWTGKILLLDRWVPYNLKNFDQALEKNKLEKERPPHMESNIGLSAGELNAWLKNIKAKFMIPRKKLEETGKRPHCLASFPPCSVEKHPKS